MWDQLELFDSLSLQTVPNHLRRRRHHHPLRISKRLMIFRFKPAVQFHDNLDEEQTNHYPFDVGIIKILVEAICFPILLLKFFDMSDVLSPFLFAVRLHYRLCQFYNRVLSLRHVLFTNLVLEVLPAVLNRTKIAIIRGKPNKSQNYTCKSLKVIFYS